LVLSRRIDFACAGFDFSAAPATPTRGSAQRMPGGYLRVDAYLARDGLLRYSDGRTSWLEWRPKAELEAAADSWHLAPVTDDHPPKMVSADNHSQYARGIVITQPIVETIDGVSYLRATIEIRDAALVRKIDAGQRELSIGFWSDVKMTRGTVGGETYDAIQTGLVGNHVASVARGRAGPAVRVLMDGEGFAWTGLGCDVCGFGTVDNCDQFSPQRPCPECGTVNMDAAGSAIHSQGSESMKIVNVPAALVAALVSKSRRTASADEAGMPTTMAKIVGPDGTELEVPTWLAALVEEAMEMRKGAGAAPKSEAPPETPPAGDEVPPPPPNGESNPDDEEEKDPPMTPDAYKAIVRKRVRLERLAASRNLPIVDDDAALARSYVAAVMPSVKCDTLDGAALDALVDAAESVPVPKAEPTNPFEVRVPVSEKLDAETEAELEFLRSTGVVI
jgi:hypothetical protein